MLGRYIYIGDVSSERDFKMRGVRGLNNNPWINLYCAT
jgi:hypothetical protein